MKVKIRKMPNSTPKYENGGKAPNTRFSQQARYPFLSLDLGNRVFSGSDIYPQDPFGTNNTLPEAEPGMASINAEKQETILGDFDNDGNNELMSVNGPSHAEGGKNVVAPQGSFVFSDTPKLKIKDPELLAIFNKTSKKGMTPAQISKGYDLNKLKAILDNPDSDYLQKNSAKLMMDGYQKKLQQLALTQEAMKGFPDGIPQLNPQNGTSEAQQGSQMKFGGYVPQMQEGGYNSYSWSQDYIPQLLKGPDTPISQGIDKYNYANTLYPSSVYGDQFTKNYANQVPNLPSVDNSVPHPGQFTPSSGSNVPFGYQTPDKVGMALAAYQLANIKKYPGYIAPMRTVLPQTTFYSPEREIAANAETANTQSMIANLTADGSRGRSIGSSIQGQALGNLGNILAKNQQANVETSNRANMANADIMNKQQAYNADRLSKLYEQNVTANQAYDNAQRQGQDNLFRTYQQAYANRQKLNMLNNTSENYYIDPKTGQFVFKGGSGLGTSGNAQNEDDWLAQRQKYYKDKFPGLTEDQALQYAHRDASYNRQRTTTNPMNPRATRISQSMDPYLQNYQTGPYGF